MNREEHLKLLEKKMAKKTGQDVIQKEVDQLLALNHLQREDGEMVTVSSQQAGAAIKRRTTANTLPDPTEDVPKGPLDMSNPLPDVPGLVEEPVDNDPTKTAAAFAEGKQDVEDIFS